MVGGTRHTAVIQPGRTLHVKHNSSKSAQGMSEGEVGGEESGSRGGEEERVTLR